MRNRNRSARLLAAVASLAWLGGTQGSDLRPLATAVRFLGPEGEDLGGERFAAAVTKAGLPAAAVSGRAAAWRQPAAAGGPWLCGVTAGFGERAHAYAFWFNPAGIPERFAHVPYGKTTLPGGTRVWLPPVDRLAAAIAAAAGRPPLSGPAMAIRIVREQSAGEAGPVADPQVFEAIAWAAACEAGWTPTAGAAPNRATLGVEAGVKSASLRLTLEAGDSRRDLIKRAVPEDDVHEVIRRMFACVLPGSVATDFFRLGVDGTLLAASPERIFCLADGGLQDIDLRACRGTWADDDRSLAARKGGGFGPWQAADGGLQIVRWKGGLATLDPATGAAALVASLQPAASWSFDLAAHRAVVASGRVVAAWVDGREAWRHEEADPVGCGPAFAGPLVIAGTSEGELFALAAAAGGVAWRHRLEPRLGGRLTVSGGLVVGFAPDTDTLVAVAPGTGQPVWSLPIGDVPVKPPLATSAGLLVATKSSRLFLLDPETGRPRAERRLPGWLSDVVLLPGREGGRSERLACLTRDGTITVLEAATLAPAAEQKLAVRPGYGRPARLLAAPMFPVAWSGPRTPPEGELDEFESELEADLADAADCLLVADEEGYAWIVPTTRLTEASR